MRAIGGKVVRLLVGLVAFLAMDLVVLPAWAIGPPVITFHAVWKNTFTTDSFPFPDSSGTPQLYAAIAIEEPLGTVPESITTVKVNVPTGGPGTDFQIPLEVKDFDHDVYLVNLTKAGVAGFPTGTYTFTVVD